jgi:hypothetical protein
MGSIIFWSTQKAWWSGPLIRAALSSSSTLTSPLGINCNHAGDDLFTLFSYYEHLLYLQQLLQFTLLPWHTPRFAHSRLSGVVTFTRDTANAAATHYEHRSSTFRLSQVRVQSHFSHGLYQPSPRSLLSLDTTPQPQSPGSTSATSD